MYRSRTLLSSAFAALCACDPGAEVIPAHSGPEDLGPTFDVNVEDESMPEPDVANANPADEAPEPTSDVPDLSAGELEGTWVQTVHGPVRVEPRLRDGYLHILDDVVTGGPYVDALPAITTGLITTRWPTYEIKYGFASGTNELTSAGKTAVRQALATVGSASGYRFVEKSPLGTQEYGIVYQRGWVDGPLENCGGLSSAVGQWHNPALPIKNQYITLGDTGRPFAECGVPSQSTVVHETLHALGFYHEQQRMDRDVHVKYNEDCVADDVEANFEAYEGVSIQATPYDLDSIMHYSSCDLCADANGEVGRSCSDCLCYPLVERYTLDFIPAKGVMSRRDMDALVSISGDWWNATSDNQSFGRTMTMGDFDGDGQQEAAIGAPFAATPSHAPGGASSSSGRVQIVKYIEFDTTPNPVPWKDLDQGGLDINENGDDFGHAVLAADLDKDGFDDLLVGAPGEGNDAGAVYVFRGSRYGLSAWARLTQGSTGLGASESGDRFGSAVTVADVVGSVNQSVDDIVIGAPGEAPGSSPKCGTVFIVERKSGGFPGHSHIVPPGCQTGDNFGASLATLRGGNGFKDAVALGKWGDYGNAGAVDIFVHDGSTWDHDLTLSEIPWLGIGDGREANDVFGFTLVSGDFNGDGWPDLAVGAAGENRGSGRVYLYRGHPSSTLVYSRVIGQGSLGANERGDTFSYSLAAADITGDGRDDLVVGAPYEAPASRPRGGYAFVFRGVGNNDLVTELQGLEQGGILDATETWDIFGYAVAAGDLDGDGRADVLVGAPGEDVSGVSQSNVGSVYLFRGGSGGATPWSLYRHDTSAPYALPAG